MLRAHVPIFNAAADSTPSQLRCEVVSENCPSTLYYLTRQLAANPTVGKKLTRGRFEPRVKRRRWARAEITTAAAAAAAADAASVPSRPQDTPAELAGRKSLWWAACHRNCRIIILLGIP